MTCDLQLKQIHLEKKEKNESRRTHWIRCANISKCVVEVGSTRCWMPLFTLFTFKINGQPTIARFKYGRTIYFLSILFGHFASFFFFYFVIFTFYFRSTFWCCWMLDARLLVLLKMMRSFRKIIWCCDVHGRRKQKEKYIRKCLLKQCNLQIMMWWMVDAKQKFKTMNEQSQNNSYHLVHDNELRDACVPNEIYRILIYIKFK